jgi:hypothetical protein
MSAIMNAGARRSRTYADDIRWTDDDGIIIGRDALDAKAIELQGRLGDLEFVVAGPTHQTRGLGFLASSWSNLAAIPRSAQVSTSPSCETASSPSSTPC